MSPLEGPNHPRYADGPPTAQVTEGPDRSTYNRGVTTLTLIGKPDCHLCDVAREVVDGVLADLPDERADRITVEERSILDDPALYERWWEKVPVVLIDGELHAHWRVAADRLRAALSPAAPARRGLFSRRAARASGPGRPR